MSELETKILLNMDGNVDAKSIRYARAIGMMRTRTERDMRSMRRSWRGLEKTGIRVIRGLSKMANRYTALVGVGTAAVGARQAMEYEDRFTDIRVQFRMDEESFAEIQRQVFEVAGRGGIQIDSSELLASVERILQLTGDVQWAMDNLENLAIAIQGTGASGEDIGSLAAELQKQDINDPEAVYRVFDIWAQQGNQGNFLLRDFANLAARLVSTYTSYTKRSGEEAMKELGAVLQVINRTSGSPEQTATAMEALLRVLNDRTKLEELGRLSGVQIYEDVEREILRPLPDLIADLTYASGGSMTALSQVFDSESARAFKTPVNEFEAGSPIQSFDPYMAVTASDFLEWAASEKSHTASANIAGAKTRLEQTIYEEAGDIINAASDLVGTSHDPYRSRKQVELLQQGWRAMEVFSDSPGMQQLSSDIGMMFSDPVGHSERMYGEVRVSIDAPVPATVTNLQSRGMDLTVDTGQSMGGQ